MPLHTDDDRSVITLEDSAGAERLDTLRHDLIMARASSAPIVVDLSDVDALDSAVLAAILVSAMTDTTRPVSVIASPRVYRGLTEWRFDTALSISEAHVTA